MADDDVRLTLLADFRLAQLTTDPQSAGAGARVAVPDPHGVLRVGRGARVGCAGAAAPRALRDLAKARKMVGEAGAAGGTTPDDMGLARLRTALAEAASVVATAASDDGAAPPDFFAVYASDVPPPAPEVAAPPRAAATDFF